MYYTVTSPPAVEPLTLVDAKLHARVDDSSSDDLFTKNIAVARQWVEDYCLIKLITQTIQVTWDYDDLNIYRRVIRLPIAPVQSITSVNTYDQENTQTLFDPGNYFLSDDRIALNNADTWPADLRSIDSLQAVMVVGFGSTADDVPDKIILAMKTLVSFWYEKRLVIDDNLSNKAGALLEEMPFQVKSLLQPYRRFFFA